MRVAQLSMGRAKLSMGEVRLFMGVYRGQAIYWVEGKQVIEPFAVLGS